MYVLLYSVPHYSQVSIDVAWLSDENQAVRLIKSTHYHYYYQKKEDEDVAEEREEVTKSWMIMMLVMNSNVIV